MCRCLAATRRNVNVTKNPPMSGKRTDNKTRSGPPAASSKKATGQGATKDPVPKSSKRPKASDTAVRRAAKSSELGKVKVVGLCSSVTLVKHVKAVQGKKDIHYLCTSLLIGFNLGLHAVAPHLFLNELNFDELTQVANNEVKNIYIILLEGKREKDVDCNIHII